jgi:CheY-like chemotaxis protein
MTTQPRAPADRRWVALIADNEAAVAQLLREVLVMSGFEVEVVGDGQQALDRLARPGIDLLVCDLMMPGVDGRAVLVARSEAGGGPPALVVSGHLDAETEGWLRAQPIVAGVFRKPFDLFEFARHAREVVRG